MVASTALTLVVVPVLYSLLDRMRRKHVHREVPTVEREAGEREVA
jgi:hypothetical protein